MARGIWECGWEVENQGRLLLGGNSMDQSRSSLYKSLRSTAEALPCQGVQRNFVKPEKG